MLPGCLAAGGCGGPPGAMLPFSGGLFLSLAVAVPLPIIAAHALCMPARHIYIALLFWLLFVHTSTEQRVHSSLQNSSSFRHTNPATHTHPARKQRPSYIFFLNLKKRIVKRGERRSRANYRQQQHGKL